MQNNLCVTSVEVAASKETLCCFCLIVHVGSIRWTGKTTQAPCNMECFINTRETGHSDRLFAHIS